MIAICEYCIFTLQKNQLARGKVCVSNLVRKPIVNTRIVCLLIFQSQHSVIFVFSKTRIIYYPLLVSFLFFYKNHYSLLLLSFNSVNQKESSQLHTHTYMMKKHIFGNDYDDTHVHFKPIIMTANSRPFTNRRKPSTPDYIG